jgi:hypothetical protein
VCLPLLRLPLLQKHVHVSFPSLFTLCPLPLLFFYPLPIYHTLLLFTSLFFFVPEIDQATEVYSKDAGKSERPAS